MKHILNSLLIACICLMAGCSTAPITSGDPEAKAHAVADYVNKRAGFIENGVADLVRIAVAAVPEGSDKAHYINITRGVSSSINALIGSGIISPDMIEQAFDVHDPLLNPGLKIAGDLISTEINRLKENGYGDAGIAILTAASKGISDGLAE